MFECGFVVQLGFLIIELIKLCCQELSGISELPDPVVRKIRIFENFKLKIFKILLC